MIARPTIEPGIYHIAIVGNPNCGKSSIFNALTGLKQKVSNYPGVTVEKHEGVVPLPGVSREVHAIDLPGTYSLNPRSADELVVHDVLLGLYPDTPRPDVILAVADATTLDRGLFLVLQLLSLGKPTVLALTMMDLCEPLGIAIDVAGLGKALSVRVVPMVANREIGLADLKQALSQVLTNGARAVDPTPFPSDVVSVLEPVAIELESAEYVEPHASVGEALRLVCTRDALNSPRYVPIRHRLESLIENARISLGKQGRTWWTVEAETRYAFIDELLLQYVQRRPVSKDWATAVDAWLTGPISGPIILCAVLFAVFVGVFTLAAYPEQWIESLFGWLAIQIHNLVPPGSLRQLLTNGVLAGVGSVVAFLPQIMLLFFFIALLEDTGYAARATFVVDRLLAAFRLHGKAFLPLFASLGCAIPGVMATRVIGDERDRLKTIFVAPFMCCSARWPVYLLIAGAVIPNRRILGWIPLPSVVLGTMFLIGVFAALVTAWAFDHTVLKGSRFTLPLDLPRYHVPHWKTVFSLMWQRSALFLKKAGTVILAMSVVMWVATHYPRNPNLTPAEQLETSFAGKAGRYMEPILRPIGFDWRLGVAVLSSVVAREVFVSSLATLYGVEVSDPHSTADLASRLQKEVDPKTGLPFFTPLRGIVIMLFYVLAMQCFSTFVVVLRETGSWKWPVLQWFYMTGSAWLVCFVVWQIGSRLGLGLYAPLGR